MCARKGGGGKSVKRGGEGRNKGAQVAGLLLLLLLLLRTSRDQHLSSFKK